MTSKEQTRLSLIETIKRLGHPEEFGMLIAAELGTEKQMARMEAIVLSMTAEERRNPKILNPSRKNRIARGAGVDISVVNRFIKQFEQSQKMMKSLPGMMGGKKGRRGGFGGLGGMRMPF